MNHKDRHRVELADGRTVRFAIAPRTGEPCYFVYFRGQDGRRIERSTRETSQKRAIDAAIQIVKEEYAPRASTSNPTWEEAEAALAKAMQANNNRQTTIDDYLDSLKALRVIYPTLVGPAEVTPKLAKGFKAEYQARGYTRRKAKPEPATVDQKPRRGRKRKQRPPTVAYTRKPRTLASRIRKLRVIWSRWFIKELEYVTENPWEAVELPRLEKLTPRYLTPDEIGAFFGWLTERWRAWRLPILFFTVKSFIGNRILELCSLTSDQLQEGRIVFPADETKGRKERRAILPPEIYAELKGLAGPSYVWEAFPTQLADRLRALERPATKVLPDFSPKRLKWWLQDEIDDYCKAHPEVKRFSAHAFRKRAMTEAWRLGIHPEKAAIAFGCNVRTMMAHYVGLDETATADEVLKAIAEAVQPKVG